MKRLNWLFFLAILDAAAWVILAAFVAAIVNGFTTLSHIIANGR